MKKPCCEKCCTGTDLDGCRGTPGENGCVCVCDEPNKRDDALDKLAKCRETLQTLSQWALPPSHEITRIARETLEQTK